MLKRKGGLPNSSAPILPVTHDDTAVAHRSSAGNRRLKQSNKSFSKSDIYGLCRFLGAIVGLGLLVVGVQRLVVKRRSTRGGPSTGSTIFHYSPKDDQVSDQQLALAEFQSLQYALDNSQLVALYFAASWCPMSTPVSEKIDQVLSDVLLPPPRGDSPSDALPQRHGLSLVYVSSDQTEEQYAEYLENRPHWMSVPFDSPERSGIKQHFHTCAKIEMDELGLVGDNERKHEIPTLIIIDGESHQVLTFNGVKDVLDLGGGAVDEWFGLSRISQALDKKFDIEAAGGYSEDGSNSGDEAV